MEDPRKTGLKNGLRQLTLEEIERVINYPGEMVLDTYNYEESISRKSLQSVDRNGL